MQAAKGKYIQFVDSDDWCEPDYLERLYEEGERTGSDIVGCDLYIEKETGRSVFDCFLPEDTRECVALLLFGDIQGWLHVKMIRRELFIKNNISFVEGLNLWEDMPACVKLFYYAQQVCYLQKPLYHYNVENVHSYTHSGDKDKLRSLIGNTNEIMVFLKQQGVYGFYKKYLLKRLISVKLIALSETNFSGKFPSYFDLYRDCKLYMAPWLGLLSRLILLACDLHMYKLAKLMFKVRKNLKSMICFRPAK